MAVRVVLTNKAQPEEGLSKLKSNVSIDETVLMSREVYQYLRSLAKNKVLVDTETSGKLPVELVDLFDEFTKIQYGEEVSAAVKKMDEYLGHLGLTEDYYYTKDIIDIDPWIHYTEQEPIRNVVYDDNGLVYNVTYVDKGITYNVVHDTSALLTRNRRI
jgi:hypothetical protein